VPQNVHVVWVSYEYSSVVDRPPPFVMFDELGPTRVVRVWQRAVAAEGQEKPYNAPQKRQVSQDGSGFRIEAFVASGSQSSHFLYQAIAIPKGVPIGRLLSNTNGQIKPNPQDVVPRTRIYCTVHVHVPVPVPVLVSLHVPIPTHVPIPVAHPPSPGVNSTKPPRIPLPVTLRSQGR
jgi:hypothetical protein